MSQVIIQVQNLLSWSLSQLSWAPSSKYRDNYFKQATTASFHIMFNLDHPQSSYYSMLYKVRNWESGTRKTQNKIMHFNTNYFTIACIPELQLMHSCNMVPQSAPAFWLMWAVGAWESWLLATLISLVPQQRWLPRIVLPTSSACKRANVSTLLCLATAFSIWTTVLVAFILKSNEPIQWQVSWSTYKEHNRCQ